MNDAILRPVIKRSSLDSSNTDAIKINANAQKTLIIFESFTSSFTPRTSLKVDDESELIDELRVDIAADSTPTSSIPLTPSGR